MDCGERRKLLTSTVNSHHVFFQQLPQQTGPLPIVTINVSDTETKMSSEDVLPKQG